MLHLQHRSYRSHYRKSGLIELDTNNFGILKAPS